MLVLQAVFAFAATSAETIVVRVQSYDPSTRTYTFSCSIPSDASASKYWTVRPDSPALEYSTQNISPTLTYQLKQNVLYHIGCQVQQNGENLRGDFHIDLRTGPAVDRPNIVALSINGSQSTLRCDYPGTNYNLYGNQQTNVKGTVYHKYSAQGTYTVSCTVHDKVTGKTASTSTQIVLPQYPQERNI